jgi:plasmid stabilization system protein ParE
METFVLRVWVAAEPEAATALRGLVDHPRTGRSASFAGGTGLVEAIELFLEPHPAEPLAASVTAHRRPGREA